MQSKRVRFSLIAAFVFVAACARPKPPSIVPEKAVITSIGPAGIGMNVELGVDNPNGIALSARSVTANVVLDGKYPLTTVTVPSEFTLAAHARTPLSVPMSLAWSNLSTLLVLASSNRSVPYDVDGSVTLGGDTLHADVPFHLSGVVTKEQLVQATMNSLTR